ncbi:MAG: 50S ribosomal protein L23 [Candidatus Pacebacteria bacterium]|nr:50S ribosomal protein L23 [Candidatus Paceibacterota bacterium]
MKSFLIKKPVITEKSVRLANEQNVYTFYVDYKASKSQIKAAIEELFEVEVIRVNTLIAPSKRRRTGKKRMPNLTTVKKKALVELKQGQTIDLFDIGE